MSAHQMVIHACPSPTVKQTTLAHDLITIKLSLKEQENQQDLKEDYTRLQLA